jgi:hypothetical protein
LFFAVRAMVCFLCYFIAAFIPEQLKLPPEVNVKVSRKNGLSANYMGPKWAGMTGWTVVIVKAFEKVMHNYAPVNGRMDY